MTMHRLIGAVLCAMSCLLVMPAAHAESSLASAARCFEVYDQAQRYTTDPVMKDWAGSASTYVLGAAVRLWDPGFDGLMAEASKQNKILLSAIARGDTQLGDEVAACNVEWVDELTKISTLRPDRFVDAESANVLAAAEFKVGNALTCTIAYKLDEENPDTQRAALSSEQAIYAGQAYARLKPEPDDTVRNELILQEHSRLDNALKAGEETLAGVVASCDRTWASEFAAARKAKADAEANAAKQAAEARANAEARAEALPYRCTRLEDRGISLVQDMTDLRLKFADDGDEAMFEYGAENIARHLSDLSEEAEYNGCEQLASEMRYVISQWKSP
ncbi:MAG: hypothetical protein R3C13_13035 [Hyphomonas sp.]|uniref:hypothetical protein n=1 Tax=Hyphomonas sp. TaxID=87 RepID=UPI0035273C4A